MKIEREKLRLYAVTDRHWLGEDTLEHQVELAILGGATLVQFREKQLGGRELFEQGMAVREVCRRYSVPFIVNDDVALAASLDADGVHVGQGDMSVREARGHLGEDKIIGVSSHSVGEAVEAVRDGADYLGAGAVFATGTKQDAGAMVHDTLRDICSAVDIPVVAIGGIDCGNVHQLSGTGIAGVAVIHGLFGQTDIRRAAADLREQVEEIVSC